MALDVRKGLLYAHNERSSLPIIARSRSALRLLVLVPKQFTPVGVTGLCD
jgi:hypothetical protein